jgi:hypothetical protein
VNLRDQVQALDASAQELSKASSIRDKVRCADRIYEILAECEKLVEHFVVTEIGSSNGHGPSRQAPKHKGGRPRKTPRRFKNMTLAEIGKVLLKEHGTLHGSKIESFAKNGGFKSKNAEHFQSYLAVAFKRDGSFVNTGRNNWKLKEDVGANAHTA